MFDYVLIHELYTTKALTYILQTDKVSLSPSLSCSAVPCSTQAVP